MSLRTGRRSLRASCSAALVAASLAAAPPEGAATPTPTPKPASAAADATPVPRVAVAPPVLSGTDDIVLRDQISAELRNGLQRGRLELLDSDRVAALAADGCGDAACVARLQAELGAAFVLRSSVSVSDRDYTLRLELVAAQNGETAATSEQTCELCGRAELRALAADQSARLVTRLEALARPPPTLELYSQPPGALVFIDGQLVGQTPLERRVLEGTHVLRVIADGHVAEERRLESVAGLRETLRISLRRTPATLKLRKAGWAALFTGIGVAALGLPLIAIDGQPFTDDCSGADVDAAGNCRYVFETRWGGAGLLAAGAVLTTVGAMLLLRTRARRSRPRASVSPFGLGLRAAF